ncbi:hypothetical protein FB384_000934 [Prauserella sediminis]|uniref:Uncharacterized protein n=1 Tax=Prauserella sediminis TaxID=577680 RepID=A0A839XFI9_9PSEU|nr:hypothetical protein [Prauserella sediminis]MBB3662030.1 hypothetical protein [Prauserella sediminis]
MGAATSDSGGSASDTDRVAAAKSPAVPTPGNDASLATVSATLPPPAGTDPPGNRDSSAAPSAAAPAAPSPVPAAGSSTAGVPIAAGAETDIVLTPSRPETRPYDRGDVRADGLGPVYPRTT